jgi:hypothetical protein
VEEVTSLEVWPCRGDGWIHSLVGYREMVEPVRGGA